MWDWAFKFKCPMSREPVMVWGDTRGRVRASAVVVTLSSVHRSARVALWVPLAPPPPPPLPPPPSGQLCAWSSSSSSRRGGSGGCGEAKRRKYTITYLFYCYQCDNMFKINYVI